MMPKQKFIIDTSPKPRMKQESKMILTKTEMTKEDGVEEIKEECL